MSGINEQVPSNTIEDPSKTLSNEVGKAEKKVGKEMWSVSKSPSREINAEDDLKTTILNLSKQIRELQKEHSSTSSQHHKFYSNPDPLRLENDLPKS